MTILPSVWLVFEAEFSWFPNSI